MESNRQALDAMVDFNGKKSGKINNVEVYRKGVLRKSGEVPSGIGRIAIPHANQFGIKIPGLRLWVVPEGVDFDSQNGERSKPDLLIAARNITKRTRTSRCAEQIISVTDG